MAEFDFKKITNDMLAAMKPVLKKNFKEAKAIADSHLEPFAIRTAELTAKVAAGTFNEDEARDILRIRKNAAEGVLAAIAAIGALTAQEAINAGLKVLREVVVKAIPGASLLI
jgi:hypothetical protein